VAATQPGPGLRDHSVLTQHCPMLQGNLLCIGVTTASVSWFWSGEKKAVAIALWNALGRRRWSKLAEWPSVDAGSIMGDVGLSLLASEAFWTISSPEES